MISWLKARWNAWEPEPTWQEAVKIIVIECVSVLAFIYVFEAIF